MNKLSSLKPIVYPDYESLFNDDDSNNNNNNSNKFCFFVDDHQPLTSICERLVNRQRADIQVVAVVFLQI